MLVMLPTPRDILPSWRDILLSLPGNFTFFPGLVNPSENANILSSYYPYICPNSQHLCLHNIFWFFSLHYWYHRLYLLCIFYPQALTENASIAFIKPKWLYTCNEKAKFVPYQPYVVVPNWDQRPDEAVWPPWELQADRSNVTPITDIVRMVV